MYIMYIHTTYTNGSWQQFMFHATDTIYSHPPGKSRWRNANNTCNAGQLKDVNEYDIFIRTRTQMLSTRVLEPKIKEVKEKNRKRRKKAILHSKIVKIV